MNNDVVRDCSNDYLKQACLLSEFLESNWVTWLRRVEFFGQMLEFFSKQPWAFFYESFFLFLIWKLAIFAQKPRNLVMKLSKKSLPPIKFKFPWVFWTKFIVDSITLSFWIKIGLGLSFFQADLEIFKNAQLTSLN